MRSLLLLALTTLCAAADAPKLVAGPEPAPKFEPVAEPPRQVTADDLNNLVICARRVLPTLTTDEIAAMAQAIKRAEADIPIIRASEAKAAAAKPQKATP